MEKNTKPEKKPVSQARQNQLKHLKPPFSSTNQPAHNGRKKSRIKSLILDYDLSATDISLMIKSVIMEMNDAELRAIMNDKEKPVFVRALARATFEDLRNGSIRNIETILSRAFGAPRQEIKNSGSVKIIYAPEEAEKL